ncbi:MAG TPA: hypothetical protein VFY40_04125, partial [Blastocatellia bacterium]|nr:hypothetical protein [Blastocatellia bacterium]
MEAARGLARRMIEEGGDHLKTRLIYGFRACAARTPEEKEIERLAILYGRRLDNFAANATEAGKVAGPNSNQLTAAEFAALTMVANVLLNLDETFTKE